MRYQEKKFRILVNSACDPAEGFEVFQQLSLVADPFLNITLDYLGFIPHDEYIRQAVSAQQAFVDCFPDCAPAKQMHAIAARLEGQEDYVKGSLVSVGNLDEWVKYDII